jgi:YjjG family noncanonical pyrimidine nucleotidase
MKAAMRPFDLILFDADGTLLDFAASERLAFQTCIQAHVEAARCEEVYRAYTAVGLPLWKALEQGSLSLTELRDRRWTELARQCSLAYEVAEISLAFVAELKRQAHVIDGAVEVCRALAESHQLGVVTNGFEEVQVARFAASTLADHIDFLVSSEAAGAHKPARAIFECALQRAGRRCSPERVLMVGDNFVSDILGAQRMGFSTCWFNPGASPAPAAGHGERGAAVDHEIRALPELLALVGR